MNVVDDQTEWDVVSLTDEVPAAVVAAADRARAEAQRVTDERRHSRRVPAADLSWLELARVKYGPDVKIVNVSRTGILLESDRPLAPGSRQALEISASERSIVVPFGVVRSRISALVPRGAVYRCAGSFTRPLELPELADVADPGPSAPAPEVAAPASPRPASSAELLLHQEPLMATVVREMAAAPVPAPAGAGQKIVARFLDGTILKGYNTDFDVNRPSFSLRTGGDDSSSGVSVPLANLKALFFVRDFDGNAAHRERKTFFGQTSGRRINITFSDGETIAGTTHGYRSGGVGFYVTPADPRANNARIFVVSSAVKQVRFP